MERAMMSMYSQLLRASQERAILAGDDAAFEPDGETLARLLVYRARLGEGHSSLGGGSARDIAANLDYDLVLLRVCASRGIESDPAAFSRPLIERRRLENELRAWGIDLDTPGASPEPLVDTDWVDADG
jgi:hypothetical protein